MATSGSSVQVRHSTLRSISSTISSFSEEDVNTKEYVDQMVKRAKEGTPMTDPEIEDICNSIQNLCPRDSPINFAEVAEILKNAAHLSHKNWGVTSENSDKLSRSLSIGAEASAGSYPLTPHAKQLMERILKDGNWQGAVDNAPPAGSGMKPWAVLVTGVNGIRKTTSMYQPWFASLLEEALIAPPDAPGSPENLPTGDNSFFRQLDHMIVTICNEEFCKLYSWAASQLPDEDEDSIPSDEVVQGYSDYKAAIFSRYRTVSELIGALLLKQAQLVNINCLMETSGKDVAMFKYIDHFFSARDGDGDGDGAKYNKLALHFTINDLECAKISVDKRMKHEIQVGAKAVKGGDAFEIVYANEGGPYGSKVLPGVQKDSDKVWNEQVLGGAVGQDWYKATISINAHPTKAWTAQAVRPDGTLGTEFPFERK
jgi:hypothetical protein